MKLKCPNGCVTDSDTPFYYAPSAFSLDSDGVEDGILATADGEPTNVWTDGTRGVPADFMDMLRGGDDLPYCCVCNAEVEVLRG